MITVSGKHAETGETIIIEFDSDSPVGINAYGRRIAIGRGMLAVAKRGEITDSDVMVTL